MIKELNNLATELQRVGMETEEGKVYWGRIAELVMSITQEKAENYVRAGGASVRVSADSLVSVALVEGITRAINNWDSNKGDFYKRYLFILNNIFVEQVRRVVNVDKRKTVAVATSIHTPIGDDITIEDTLVDTANSVEAACVPSVLSEAFAIYEEQFGTERAGLAKVIILNELAPATRSKAICEYLKVDEYSAAVRKKVERTRKHFLSFCATNKEMLLG